MGECMRYVIMANGKGRRWKNYEGKPKHLIEVDGETLLARTTRLVSERDSNAEVFIASANPLCVAPGAQRHVPMRNAHELDRFCYELIEDGTCFLYGDVFYTASAIDTIIKRQTISAAFFGNEHSIVAVKVGSAKLVKDAIDGLVALLDKGELTDAKGWQLYHWMEGMPLNGHAIGGGFNFIHDATRDFNTPDDWETFKSERASCSEKDCEK